MRIWQTVESAAFSCLYVTLLLVPIYFSETYGPWIGVQIGPDMWFGLDQVVIPIQSLME